jgi:hypothetical protein
MVNLKFEEWKVATDEAMHFNDLLMRNRQIGFTIIIAILWGATQIKDTINIFGYDVLEAFIIGLIALIFAFALYFIDLNYYFRLLIGAVERAENLETKLRFELTKNISKKVTRIRAWGSLHFFYILILLCNVLFLSNMFFKIIEINQ